MLNNKYIQRLCELAGVPSCLDFLITDQMKEEIKPFSTSEEFLRAGGFSIEALDRAAFGFSDQDIKQLNPNQINIKWKSDMLNPPEKQRVSGLSKMEWAKTMDFSEPVEVSYSKGKFWLEDGHHRYYAAKILNRPLDITLEIKDTPILKLSHGLSYDDYHRKIFNCIKNTINK